ncbi:phosphatase PAP2 family protein [Sphingomonas asaccharolytica]|uniref:phosphatase PAP2 family protein n=1 Tax=Sphingomonas asaccharolytica TaxID=40681 RepID=UPI000AA8DBB4|nr:phosphatase PAP2 family protein [Sphingomonas asaccharolytica]
MIARYLVPAAFAVSIAMSCVQAQTLPPAEAAVAKAEPSLLDPAEFAPARTFAPPPPHNSRLEALELQQVKALRAAASPERLAQAERDGDTENPTAFDQATGRDLARLPATYALLTRIQRETNNVVSAGKDYFRRLRPYGVDPQMAHCGKGKVADRSYPSGHGGMAWSVGWALARLMPDRAPAIIARAQDYALSREICGVHFQSDLEASHGVAVVIADRLLADPRLADQVAAARRELARP